ncbi:MAG: hypothetical protein IT317_07175 [Anaerolineales bacterium]|nr:hypothetical protein [Anaerolineales bacterium]
MKAPHQEARVTAAEWRWVFVFALAVMTFTLVPYLAAWSAARDGWQFGGFLLAVEDGNAYLARMGRGARGQLLETLSFSTEPQRGTLLLPALHLLGWLAGPDPRTELIAYHTTRVLSGIGLLAASYTFLAAFVISVTWRRVALVLVALGGGLGWLIVVLVPGGAWLGSLPPDLILPEAFSFLVLFNFIHLALARALLLLALLAYLRGRGRLAGGLLLLAGLNQPLAIALAGALMGLHATLGWLLRRRFSDWPWPRDLRTAMVAGLIAGPFLLYVTISLRLDPLLRQWMAQNILSSPPPIHYLLAYAVLLLPAWSGLRALWGTAPRLAVLAAAWIVLALLLAYLPVPPQRRFLEGVQLPLAALAALGLSQLARPWRRPAAGLVLALSLPTTLLVWLGALGAARLVQPPIFRPPDELAAFAWLRANAHLGDAGLAAYATGNALPAYTPLSAYVGHGPETVFLADKLLRVFVFYAAATPDSDRRALLNEAGIDYVLFGPNERALGDFDPSTADYLAERFTSGRYAVYAVLAP